MKKYRHDKYIEYPVGENMHDNLKTINAIAKKLLFHVNKTMPEANVNLWCTGSSGAIMAAIVCDRLSSRSDGMCRICHVKKEGEQSHTDGIRPLIGNELNVVIDDFVYSGATMVRITRAMRSHGRLVDCVALGGTFANSWLDDGNIFEFQNISTVICR